MLTVPAKRPCWITGVNGARWLVRPVRNPVGTMAGFGSKPTSEPVGGMAGFETGSGGCKYRPTVSRCMPSSRAILRADQPLAASVATECSRFQAHVELIHRALVWPSPHPPQCSPQVAGFDPPGPGRFSPPADNVPARKRPIFNQLRFVQVCGLRTVRGNSRISKITTLG